MKFAGKGDQRLKNSALGMCDIAVLKLIWFPFLVFKQQSRAFRKVCTKTVAVVVVVVMLDFLQNHTHMFLYHCCASEFCSSALVCRAPVLKLEFDLI